MKTSSPFKFKTIDNRASKLKKLYQHRNLRTDSILQDQLERSATIDLLDKRDNNSIFKNRYN